MSIDEGELEFYRAIEDLFAAARGVPHVLSPKDFQLLRQWWAEGVPLEAVAAGVAEVVARRRDSGDADPVTSLRYCRHAVRRQAARLIAMRTGAAEGGGAPAHDEAAAGSVAALADELRSRAAALADREPAVARVLDEVAGLVDATSTLAAAEIEGHLWALESTLLDRCWQGLSETERSRVDGVAQEVAASSADPSTRERAHRAGRDRELRRRLGLPRLELTREGLP